MELERFPYSEYRTTTPRTMFDKATQHLQEKGFELESTSLGARFEYDPNCPPDGPVPRHQWLAIYAIEGGNEGHYVHADFIIVRDGDRASGCATLESLPLMFVKTFGGLETAIQIADALTRFFVR